MTAAPRRRLQGLIPWLALCIVVLFAFAQMRQRARAEARLAQRFKAPPTPTGPAKPAASAGIPAPASKGKELITARERALDQALEGAQQALQKVRASKESLRVERDTERARAERLAASASAQSRRADALEARMVAVGERIQEAADARLLQARREAHEARGAAEKASKRLNEIQTDHQRDVVSLTRRVAALGSQRDRTQVALARCQERLQAAQEGREALRRRETVAVRLQLAALDVSNLVTGARLVGMLHLKGHAARLLALTAHEASSVRAAAAGALAGAADLETVRAAA